MRSHRQTKLPLRRQPPQRGERAPPTPGTGGKARATEKEPEAGYQMPLLLRSYASAVSMTPKPGPPHCGWSPTPAASFSASRLPRSTTRSFRFLELASWVVSQVDARPGRVQARHRLGLGSAQARSRLSPGPVQAWPRPGPGLVLLGPGCGRHLPAAGNDTLRLGGEERRHDERGRGAAPWAHGAPRTATAAGPLQARVGGSPGCPGLGTRRGSIGPTWAVGAPGEAGRAARAGRER